MVNLSGVSDRELEELQNEAYRERLSRMSNQGSDPARASAPQGQEQTAAEYQRKKAAQVAGPETSPITLDNVDSAFQYHPWNPDQVEAGNVVREALVAAVKAILRVVPRGPDRTVAIRKIREARMDANSGITHNGRF